MDWLSDLVSPSVCLVINLVVIGSGLAVVVGLALSILPPRFARMRYWIAVAAFGAAALGPVLGTTSGPMTHPRLLEPVQESSSPGLLALPALWLGVSLLLLARELLGHAALFYRGRSWEPAPAEIRRSLAWPAEFALVTAHGEGPSTVGLLRPRVVLPRGWLATLPLELSACVARHELAHARWRDPLLNAAVRVLRALFWPGIPLWLLERMIRVEREAAADVEALSGSGRDLSKAYAALVIEAAARSRRCSSPRLSLGGRSEGARLERRIRRLLGTRREGRFRLAAGLTTFVLGAGLVFTLPVAQLPSAVPGPLPLPASASASASEQAAAVALNEILAATRFKDHTLDATVKPAISRLQAAGSLTPLLGALSHPDRRVRESAAWVAGVMGDPRTGDALSRAAADRDPHVRETATWALSVSSR